MVDFFRILNSERHIAFCPMNFVADTYKGCPHACWYCYAPSFSAPGKFDNSFSAFRNYRRRFERDNDFKKVEVAVVNGNVKGTCNKKQEELVATALKHMHPLRIGSVSEPFGMPLENQYGDTYRVLEILIAHNYPFVACTKSPLVATPRYINLLKSARERVAVQISLISLDDNLLKYLESRPGGNTPSAKSRLDTLRKLSDEGIFTVCRIQPMIPRVTEYGMRDLIFALAEAGVKHIIVEFLWFPMGHAKNMSTRLKLALDAYCEAGGIVGDDLKVYQNDLNDYYRSFEDSERAYGRIFYSKKQMAQLMPKFAEMVSEANKEYNSNMTFGSGNEETSYLNFTDNCCGVDRLPSFSGYPTCTAQTMLKIAKHRGKVTLNNLKEYYNPDLSKFEQVWKKKDRKGRYFIESRVFKLRACPTADQSEVEYVYDEAAIPS